jgi:DNA polymerase-3 subunit chi
MTRVDFYRLPAAGSEAVERAACLVAGKAYRAGYHVRIFAESSQLDTLDEKLWTYRPGAFVPHASRERVDPDWPEPVILADDCRENGGAQVLICVVPPPADCLDGFERVAEFVTQDDPVREAARQRYAAYRQAGHELHAHDLRLN